MLGVVCTLLALAQMPPVRWSVTATKMANKIYEVRVAAVVTDSWNTYTSNTQQSGEQAPARIAFINRPLIHKNGNMIIIGAMEQKQQDVFDMAIFNYKRLFVFSQIVRLKTNIATSITGSIQVIASSNEQCLYPTTIPFSIVLE